MRLVYCMLVGLMVAGVAAGEWVFDHVLYDFELPPDNSYGVHGVVVDPEGKVWIALHGGITSDPVIDSVTGDTLGWYRPIYILDPETGQHVSFSPLKILELWDGTLDTLWTGSPHNGSGKGITLDNDGNILYSSWATLYRIDYHTGHCLNRFIPSSVGLPMSSITEAVQDTNGFIYLGYVLGDDKPIIILDNNFNYIGNAVDSVGYINRSLVVSPDGKDIWTGSTWLGIGIVHWHSDIPGVLPYTPVDTFGTWDSMYVESVYVDGEWHDTAYWAYDVDLWPECLDVGPDGNLWAGCTQLAWTQDYENAPIGSRWYVFDFDTHEILYTVGIPMGDPHAGGVMNPRGAAWTADGNILYLADYDYNIVTVWRAVGVEETHDIGLFNLTLKPNPAKSTKEITITFTLTKEGVVDLKVYDIAGRVVKTLINKHMAPGTHKVRFDTSRLPPGTYFCRMAFDGKATTQKMLIVK